MGCTFRVTAADGKKRGIIAPASQGKALLSHARSPFLGKNLPRKTCAFPPWCASARIDRKVVKLEPFRHRESPRGKSFRRFEGREDGERRIIIGGDIFYLRIQTIDCDSRMALAVTTMDRRIIMVNLILWNEYKVKDLISMHFDDCSRRIFVELKSSSTNSSETSSIISVTIIL